MTGTLTLTPASRDPGNGSPLVAIAYRLISDGTKVTAYDNAGAQVAQSTDGGSVLSAVLPDAGSAGATIGFRNDGHAFPWASTPALPAALTGKLVIDGGGATVQLSATAPRFLDLDKQADYDTFQHLDVGNFVIDANHVSGKHHVVLGTYINGVEQTKISVKDIYLHDIRTYNVPSFTQTGISTATEHRLNIHFEPTASVGDATLLTISDIIVERVRFEGGNEGVGILGGGGLTNGSPLNIVMDRIVVRHWWHSTLGIPTSGFAASNVQVGGKAKIGSFYVGHGYGYGSGDVGVEVNSAANGLVEHVVIEDAWNAPFYHRIYNNPLYAQQAQVTWRKCQARALNVTGTTNARGWSFVVDPTMLISVGEVTLEDCSYYRATAEIGARGEAITFPGQAGAGFDKLTVRNFRAVVDAININAGSATMSMISIESVGRDAIVDIKGFRCRVAGTVTGATLVCYGIRIANGQKVTFDISDYYPDFSLTGGASNTLFGVGIGISGGTLTTNGTIRGMRPVNLTTDLAATGISIRGTDYVTISSAIRIIDCDLSACVTAKEITFFTDTGDNRAKVFAEKIAWKVNPKPSAAMGTTNFAAAAFTSGVGNQYLGLTPAEIHFANGTGAAITKIEVSKDGTTYEEVWNQASGVMSQDVLVPVDNGDYVKVTFATTQPTTRVRFKK